MNGQTTSVTAGSIYYSSESTPTYPIEHVTVFETAPTNATGGGGAHNHGFTQPTFTGTAATLSTIQTSKVVYRWHRTA